jgi:hypothetical protein
MEQMDQMFTQRWGRREVEALAQADEGAAAPSRSPTRKSGLGARYL